MKKVKLLAPILGGVAALATVLPVVSCGDPETDETIKVFVVNANEETKKFVHIDCSKDEATFGEDLPLTITWYGAIDSKYYSDLTSVEIDGDVYLQKYGNREGFEFNGYASDGNGINITIPSGLIRKGKDITINVYIKKSEFDLAIPVKTYRNEGVRFRDDEGNVTPYDVVSSDDSTEGQPHYFDVNAGETILFAIDMDALKAGRESESPEPEEFKNDGEIYLIITYYWYGTNYVIPLDNDNLTKLFLGDIELTSNDEDGIITIDAPTDGGWMQQETSISTITGSYTFENSYDDVKISVGLESKHAPTP